MVPRPPSPMPEQRTATRIPAARVPSIESVRLSPGDMVSTLVNISTSGVLVECTAKPRPGSAVTVHFVGTFKPATVRGRVARTMVASLGQDGVLNYMVGIAFDQSIALEEHLGDASQTVQPPDTPRVVSRLQNRW